MFRKKSSNPQPIDAQALAKNVQLTSLLSKLSLLALILTLGMWTLLVSPPKEANPWVIATVQTLPLLMFLPAVLRGWPRAHAWLCFVVLLYFTAGVLDATTPGRQWLGALEIVLTSLLFTSAMFFARWKSQLMA